LASIEWGGGAYHWCHRLGSLHQITDSGHKFGKVYTAPKQTVCTEPRRIVMCQSVATAVSVGLAACRIPPVVLLHHVVEQPDIVVTRLAAYSAVGGWHYTLCVRMCVIKCVLLWSLLHKVVRDLRIQVGCPDCIWRLLEMDVQHPLRVYRQSCVKRPTLRIPYQPSALTPTFCVLPPL